MRSYLPLFPIIPRMRICRKRKNCNVNVEFVWYFAYGNARGGIAIVTKSIASLKVIGEPLRETKRHGQIKSAGTHYVRSATQTSARRACLFLYPFQRLCKRKLNGYKKLSAHYVCTQRSLWSEWRDLNSRPYGPEPYALPNCATPR